MAVHDLGYRPWNDATRPDGERVGVIAETGVRLAWRSMWLRRMLLVAWLPAVLIGLMFFTFENVAKNGNAPVSIPFGPPLSLLAGFREVATAVQEGGPEAARHTVWGWLLLTFFRYPQGTLMIIMVGLIAPPLIAQDMRSRAYLIYFSRPLASWEYALGKALIVCGYLAMITTVPALCLYVLGVLLSPDLNVLRYTWDLPLRILAASVIVMIPTTSLALCYSSLTRESRYAAFAWFATWMLGWVAYEVLTLTSFDDQAPAIYSSRWILLSLYHTFGSVQSWVFGIDTDPEMARNGALMLAIISVVSWGTLMRRIEAPLRE